MKIVQLHVAWVNRPRDRLLHGTRAKLVKDWLM